MILSNQDSLGFILEHYDSFKSPNNNNLVEGQNPPP